MKIKNIRRGFTLIELLVVVIIIAILAAIALPQYQKAVMKSRFASLKPIAKSVKDAQEMYYHRNGQYAGQSELADLDVGIPQEASIDISAEGDHQYIRANHTGLPHNSYTAYLDHSSNFAGNIYCEAYTGDANAEQLCMAEGGTAGPVNGEYTLYLLSGNSTGEFGSAAFSSPSNAFATVYRYMVEECAQTSGCSNGLRKALAGEGYEGYDTSYSMGSADNPIISINGWNYWHFDGSSYELYASDGNATLSMYLRDPYSNIPAYSSATVSCSGSGCTDICGSSSCSVLLSDW